jgi:hypothetical protein
MHRFKRFSYDIAIYPFRELVSEYLCVAGELESMVDSELKIYGAEDCLHTSHQIKFKKAVESDERLIKLLDFFISNLVRPLFNEEILHERVPMLRVHQPNNLAVFDFHTDKDYLAPPEYFEVYEHEHNFWMPLTNAYDTNTVWLESEPGKGDFAPICSQYGELIQFDGANLMHGNHINTTKQTRVSLDFRVLPKRIFDNFALKVADRDPKMVSDLQGYYGIR